MENLRRNYEISVWTLQDSFITVLKPSNLKFKGQIVDPLMNIKDDGENKLSLKIPMYIRNDSGEMVENPLWCNTRNGTIIVDLRKLKIIFNKATTSEEVFEFLITNVKEEHEGLKKYCEVECEGLAFHELGKQGYKIALEGGDEIEIEQKKYFDGKSEYTVCPQPTINYWADKVFKGSNWRYSIQMDWSAQDGITHQVLNGLDSDNYALFTKEQRNTFNTARAMNGLRRRDRVYEDSFVSAWEYDENTGKLTPKTITEEREKYRLIEASESNRYNLSQTIAETFQVYCKYKYYYDDNYHIIDREVIFYNNFLNESQGVIDLTYKYNTEHLTRIMDATDTVSKMYVRPLNDGDAPTGQALISDTDANKSKEDYLLNFDYLYNIGTITQEQYDEIEPYYAKLHKINKRLIEINEELIAKENEKIKQEARKKTAEDAIALDTENISNNDAIARNLGDEEGNIHVTADNPQTLFLILENNKSTYYCNFKTQGIIRDSIELYWTREYNSENKKYKLKDKIKIYNIENDEFGEVSKVVNINKGEHTSSYIYAIFNYSPNTYFKKVSEIYGIRLGQDQAIVEDATKKIGDLEIAISNLTDEQDTLLEQKVKIIDSFERMMGPALREGTWQPEDEYSNYGEVYEKEIQLTKEENSTNDILSLGWDNELFDSEQDLHYQYGAILEDRCYPCIEITSALLNALTSSNYNITDFLSQLTLIYKNAEVGNEQRIKQYIAINSKMKIAFLRNIKKGTNDYNKVVPVLMITDAATMDSEQLTLLQSTGYLAYISSNITTGVISETVTYTNLNWLIKPTEITNNKNYEIVYPRFKINSLFVKSPYTMITVKRQESTNWELLTNYENFYILPRTSYYTVTIKPEAIFLSTNPLNFPLNYKIYFTISMSPLAIYLDAVQVLKENSFPKVSYEIDVMSVNEEFVYSDYLRLGQIAHINDYEFRFENTLGYISELDLDLDKPWQDKVVIKNYKTKFEDIFSTIATQTEQMKKNSATIAMAASAFNSDGTLSSSVLGESLMSEILARAADNTTDGSVPSPATEFMKYDPLIRNELRQTYNEAGQVLAAASKSVEDVIALNLNNADILGNFQINVAENMAPTYFTDDLDGKRYDAILSRSGDNFKPGDVWEHNNILYTAIQNSSNVQYETNEDALTSTKGWAATKNGQLAISNISGAYLTIDAQKGEIEIAAQKQVQLICGGEINLYSNDVVITGEEDVIIGGPNVTIYSTDTIGNNTRGVHIFASRYNSGSSLSAVDITGNGIEMRASKGIRMLAGSGIDFISSDDANTTVMSLSKDKGIYLGSNQPIKFFSGDFSSGASAEISKDRILFGVSNNTDSTTAVDLTKDYIIFGAGSIVNSTNRNSIGDTQAGIQITKDAIKMASSNATNRSYFVLDKDKIEFGAANSSSTGAFIKLAQNGQVTIGVGGNKVVTDASTGFKSISSTSTSAKFEVYAPNFIVTSEGYLHANAVNISGTIRATAGEIGGWKIDTDAIYSGTKGNSNANEDITLMSVGSFSRTIGGISRDYLKFAIGSCFGVDSDGWLYASHANIKGDIQADTGYFSGELRAATGSFSGKITADEGEIGGWIIEKDDNNHGYLYYGNNVPGDTPTSLLLFPFGFSTSNSIAGSKAGDFHYWCFTIGQNFGITDHGEIYALSANIAGKTNITGETSIDTSGNIYIKGNSLKIISQDNYTGINIFGTDSGKKTDIKIHLQAAFNSYRSKISLFSNGILFSAGTSSNYIAFRERTDDLDEEVRTPYELAFSQQISLNIKNVSMQMNGFKKITINGDTFFVLTYIPSGLEWIGDDYDLNIPIDLDPDLENGGLII